PGRRPRPQPRRRRGQVLRRDRHVPLRAGPPGDPERRPAVHRPHPLRGRPRRLPHHRAGRHRHRAAARTGRLHHPGRGRRLRRGHPRPPGRLAHAPAVLARRLRPRRHREALMGALRIGIVSPYSFDVAGGVQFHIRDLAETLIDAGHQVSVLAPATATADLPDYVVPGGKAVAVPYNGSIARLAFGPRSAPRVRRWCIEGDFDVLHVHEPLTPSLACLAVLTARCPVVATFHTAITRSRMLAAGKNMAQLVLENLSARIAVSPYARKVQVEHLGGGAVEIPNGVPVAFYRKAAPFEGKPEGAAIGFVG